MPYWRGIWARNIELAELKGYPMFHVKCEELTEFRPLFHVEHNASKL